MPTNAPKRISTSECRRLQFVHGPTWWVDDTAAPNGIGPVCLYCNRLIDWGPRDHTATCIVREFFDLPEEG